MYMYTVFQEKKGYFWKKCKGTRRTLLSLKGALTKNCTGNNEEKDENFNNSGLEVNFLIYLQSFASNVVSIVKVM